MKIYVIVGPSGAGKTTVGNILETLDINKVVTTTTRDIRDGEENGKSYYFLNKEEFEKNEFVEKTIYAGEYYGTSKDEIEKYISLNKDVFIVTDINGLNSFKEKYDNVISIFVFVSKRKVKSRLFGRDKVYKKVKSRIDRYSEDIKSKKICDFKIYNYDIRYLERKLKSIIDLY